MVSCHRSPRDRSPGAFEMLSGRKAGEPATSVRTVSFRVTITLAVLALITALAVCLITIQLLSLHAAAKEAASAYMDAAAAATESKLEAQITNLNGPYSGTIAEPISR